MAWPRRVICLTEETVETLYAIGADALIVGVSGFTVRPPQARKTKPRVSSFLDANFDKILELKPDLVLGFSDLQAELGAELCRRGVQVHLFNQRSIEEVLDSIELTCAMVGRGEEGVKLTAKLRVGLDAHRERASQLPRRVRGFFEEWHEPLISGIRWCSELMELCGADDICIETRTQQGAKGRIYAPEEVARRDPEVVIGSWCGRKMKRDKILARPGWDQVTAVKNDQLYEVKSPIILQPGIAALTDGVDQLSRIVAAVAQGDHLPPPLRLTQVSKSFHG